MNLMPSCQGITERASEYLDRDLPRWKRMSFRMHLLMCIHCRRYVSQLKLTIDTIGKIPEATPPVPDEKQIREIIGQLQRHTATTAVLPVSGEVEKTDRPGN
jgi:predicted anti-sigma-YlaC factor YlaD